MAGGTRLVMGHGCMDKVMFSVYRFLSKRMQLPGGITLYQAAPALLGREGKKTQ